MYTPGRCLRLGRSVQRTFVKFFNEGVVSTVSLRLEYLSFRVSEFLPGDE